MSEGQFSTLRRLDKIERQIAAAAKELNVWAGCICGELCVAMEPKNFEAETARRCPVHGLRRLEQLIIITLADPDHTLFERSVELHRLLKAYSLRLSADEAQRVQERT
jgi:hypothetical protein